MNLYAYCGNNPVMYSDPSGHSVILALAIAAIAISGAVGGVVAGVTAYNEGKDAGEITRDVLTGIGIGLAVSGATVALVGAFTVIGGGAAATIFGTSALRIFAVGALGFDITAFMIAPVLGFSMQGIEIGTTSSPVPVSPYSSPYSSPTYQPYPYFPRSNSPLYY